MVMLCNGYDKNMTLFIIFDSAFKNVTIIQENADGQLTAGESEESILKYVASCDLFIKFCQVCPFVCIYAN